MLPATSALLRAESGQEADGGGVFSTMIGTRRFNARPIGLSLPSGLRFGATGFCSPNPFVEMLAAGTPPFFTNQIRYHLRALARQLQIRRARLRRADQPVEPAGDSARQATASLIAVASVVSEAPTTSGAASREPGTTRQKSRPSAARRWKRGRAVSSGPTMPNRSTK